jgi:Pectate lyase superfamily protein
MKRSSQITFATISTLLFCLFITVNAELTLNNRAIAWNPGITVVIPAQKDTVNLSDYGAKGDSITDNAPAFTAAINALPSSGGVIRIASGKFIVSQSITIGKSIIIAGNGYNSTKFYFTNSDMKPCFDVLTYQRGTWVGVTSGYTKGSTQLQVTDASSFTPGCFVELQQSNDSSIMYTKQEWKQSWAENAVGQINTVLSVTGNTVKLTRPLYLDYSEKLLPQIRKQGFVTFAGFENFYITKTAPSADGATFSFKNAAYCHVKNVESDHTRKAHITCETVFASEFSQNYFHHSYDYGGDGHGYGISLSLHTTDCLIENSIFYHLRHAMLTQLGASGNVFGYNYSAENVQGTGETNLNQGWTPCDISMHGHFPNNNLYESNVVQEIDISDYWGPCGSGNTLFRNKVVKEGIDILDNSHNQNILANIIPTVSYGVLIDYGITGTLSHGNTIDGLTQWDNSTANHSFPSSYYLTSKPSFYTTEPWPAFGPDVYEASKIPAENRFEKGMFIVKTKPRIQLQNDKHREENLIYNTLGRQLTNTQHSVSVQSKSSGVFITTPKNKINVKLR